MKILLLYVNFNYASTLSYLDDWIDAFVMHPELEVDLADLYVKDSSNIKQIRQKIEKASHIVIHHSVLGDTSQYIEPYVKALKHRRGKLLCFVGNEVNLPTIGMKAKISLLKTIEPQIIATQLLQPAGEWLYAECRNKVISIFHALNPKVFSPKRSYEERNIDVGTRSNRYLPHLGDNDRNRLINYFSNVVPNRFHLRCDTDATTRFNRSEWATFLNHCKTTISTEAGSFYLDRDDTLITNVDRFLRKNNKKLVAEGKSLIRTLARILLPKSVKNKIKKHVVISSDLDKNIDFDVLYENVIKKHPKCPEYSKTISSRHFDAIGTKTLQILMPGRYADILKPYQHYLPLASDFSNIEEIIALMKDKNVYSRITESAYEHVITNHTYQHRINRVIEVLK